MKIKEKRQYFNENFFESIDSEIKAYLLGFLFADGYVNIRRNNTSYRFGVEVSEKDKSILYLFIQYIYPYSNMYTRNPRTRNKEKDLSARWILLLSLYRFSVHKSLDQIKNHKMYWIGRIKTVLDQSAS